MKSSSISVSNAMILSVKEWIITILLFAVISATIYYGWNSWEEYAPGPDHRETCWAEKQSDYWAYNRWLKYVRQHYKVLLIGDSVIWGQEVRNDETISHYINEFHGEDIVANCGNDGLFMAGINGIVNHYGGNLDNANIILQLSPLWISSLRRDLRGAKKFRYHHPRLIPQFSSRITYYHDLNTRLGYQFEHYFKLFPFVRHLMANYYDNKSISSWINDNPYRNPFTAITFQAAPVMAESQGKGISWISKGIKLSDASFVIPSESIQWECFVNALKKLQAMNSRVFVLIGPYNHYMHTPGSQRRLFSTINILKKNLDDMKIPYFDTLRIEIPSDTFADSCHLLKEGHIMLAEELTNDAGFRKWLAAIE